MNKQEYIEIAAACDRLLADQDTSLGRLAIPLLHVVNEHPSWLAQYESLLRADPMRSPPTLTNPARAGVRMSRALIRSLRAGRLPLQGMGRVDVLIVSHLGSPACVNEEQDFYFGSMQRLLLERGATSALVLVNHRASETERLAHVARPFPSARLLVPRAVVPRVEARIWRCCLAVRGQLRRMAHSFRDTIDGAVAMLASREALSAGTAANLRLHAGIAEICGLLNPRIVMTTYEGVALERMVWHAARSGGRRPLCVGYQHTRMLPHAHAIRRLIRAPRIDCDPDVILSLGEISHATLAASPGLDSVRLIPYGSHRRVEPVEQAPFGERTRLCLVLADGDERESTILFEFALACASRMPQAMFVLRPHPVVNLACLLRRQVWLRELPPNVTWSAGKTLEEECARARYCLYRGSSAAMHAVLAGVKPFYVARAGELPFDPLFELAGWRETVTAPKDFSERVLDATSPDMEAARRAWSYCDRYVSRVRPSAVDELLKMS